MDCLFLPTESGLRCKYCGKPSPTGRLLHRNCTAIKSGKATANNGTKCVHFGDELRRETCEGCGGNWQIKVFACSHPAHGETTLKGCERCKDFAPSESSTPTARQAESPSRTPQ